jgi:hypothetical protein
VKRTWLTSGVIAAALACSTPPSNSTFVEQVPDRPSFPVVAQALVRHCGSLDCHGTVYRNLRVFGNEGLRWSPTDRTLDPLCTTSTEVDQDYDSVVGLEPEVMSQVVADHGASPDRLTMIRKARGTEAHKGGTLMQTGDDLDTCITSWLAAQVDTAACQRTAPPTDPPPASGQAPACEPGP